MGNRNGGAGSNGAQFTPEQTRQMMAQIRQDIRGQSERISKVVQDESASIKEHVTASEGSIKERIQQVEKAFSDGIVDAATLVLNKNVEENEKTRKFAGDGFADLKARLNGGLSVGRLAVSAGFGMLSGFWSHGIFARGLETTDGSLLMIYAVSAGSLVFGVLSLVLSVMPPFVRKVSVPVSGAEPKASSKKEESKAEVKAKEPELKSEPEEKQEEPKAKVEEAAAKK